MDREAEPLPSISPAVGLLSLILVCALCIMCWEAMLCFCVLFGSCKDFVVLVWGFFAVKWVEKLEIYCWHKILVGLYMWMKRSCRFSVHGTSQWDGSEWPVCNWQALEISCKKEWNELFWLTDLGCSQASHWQLENRIRSFGWLNPWRIINLENSSAWWVGRLLQINKGTSSRVFVAFFPFISWNLERYLSQQL